jgi:hypothetical protein
MSSRENNYIQKFKNFKKEHLHDISSGNTGSDNFKHFKEMTGRVEIDKEKENQDLSYQDKNTMGRTFYKNLDQNNNDENINLNSKGTSRKNNEIIENEAKKPSKLNKSINQHSKIDYISDYQSDEELRKVILKAKKDRDRDKEDFEEQKNKKVVSLERSIHEIEEENREIDRNLENLKKIKLDDKSIHSVHRSINVGNVGNFGINSNNLSETNKLVHENNVLKSDIIMFKEELNYVLELNRRMESDLTKQRNRKY